MDDEFTDDLAAPGTPSSRHALLVAALLHLMSQYTLRKPGERPEDGPCVKLAAVIERHLEALARLPDVEPVLRATCEQLGDRWAELVDSRMPAPRQRPLFQRWLGARAGVAG
jgi:hypothetical protein